MIDLMMTWWDEKVNDLVTTWWDEVGHYSRWDGASGGSRAIALGPIGQHELHAGIQRYCMSHAEFINQ